MTMNPTSQSAPTRVYPVLTPPRAVTPVSAPSNERCATPSGANTPHEVSLDIVEDPLSMLEVQLKADGKSLSPLSSASSSGASTPVTPSSPKGVIVMPTTEGTVEPKTKSVSILTRAVNYAKANPVKAAVIATAIVLVALGGAYVFTHVAPLLIAMAVVFGVGVLTCLALHMNRKVEVLPTPERPKALPFNAASLEQGKAKLTQAFPKGIKAVGPADVVEALSELSSMERKVEGAVHSIRLLSEAKRTAESDPKKLEMAKKDVKAKLASLEKVFVEAAVTKGLQATINQLDEIVGDEVIYYGKGDLFNGTPISIRSLISSGGNAEQIDEMLRVDLAQIGPGIDGNIDKALVTNITAKFAKNIQHIGVGEALAELANHSRNITPKLKDGQKDVAYLALKANYEDARAFNMLVDATVRDLSLLKEVSEEEMNTFVSELANDLYEAGPLANSVEGKFIESVHTKMEAIKAEIAAQKAEVVRIEFEAKISNTSNDLGLMRKNRLSLQNQLINRLTLAREVNLVMKSGSAPIEDAEFYTGLSQALVQTLEARRKAAKELSATAKQIAELGPLEIAQLNASIASIEGQLADLNLEIEQVESDLVELGRPVLVDSLYNLQAKRIEELKIEVAAFNPKTELSAPKSPVGLSAIPTFLGAGLGGNFVPLSITPLAVTPVRMAGPLSVRAVTPATDFDNEGEDVFYDSIRLEAGPSSLLSSPSPSGFGRSQMASPQAQQPMSARARSLGEDHVVDIAASASAYGMRASVAAQLGSRSGLAHSARAPSTLAEGYASTLDASLSDLGSTQIELP